MEKAVSICLAMYNGESFISEQLSSILPQLSDSDEIVICDDCSCEIDRSRLLGCLMIVESGSLKLT